MRIFLKLHTSDAQARVVVVFKARHKANFYSSLLSSLCGLTYSYCIVCYMCSCMCDRMFTESVGYPFPLASSYCDPRSLSVVYIYFTCNSIRYRTDLIWSPIVMSIILCRKLITNHPHRIYYFNRTLGLCS